MTLTPMPVPLTEQIAEVKRELALRENVYPTFVARGRMTALEAERHTVRLTAALHTLMWVERHQAKLRTINLDPSQVPGE